MFERLGTLQDKDVRHFSHNDSDGYGPGIAGRFSKVNTLDFIPCSYANFEVKLLEWIGLYEEFQVLEGHAILITDIAPKSHDIINRLNNLHTRGLTLVLLDHHDTARFIEDAYPEWAFVESHLEGKKTCGTELYHLYLKEKDLYSPEMAASGYLDNFVELIRAYDTWDWTITGNVTAKNLNNLLYVFGPNKFMDIQVEKILENYAKEYVTEYTFTELEHYLITIDNKAEQKYIQGRAKNLAVREWHVNGEKFKVGVVYADQFHSVLGNELHKLNPELDFVALYDMNGAKVSLRSIHDHVHLGHIAKAIHPDGGGHPPSAGFPFNFEESLDKMERVMEVDMPTLKQSVLSRFLTK